MYALLLVLIVLLFTMLKAREHFGLIVGGNDWFSFDTSRTDGTEVVSLYPNTCPGHKPELDAGLCYERCRTGYNGVGPVCWAQSVNVGVGKPVGLEPCPDGWVNDGLICREPIRCGKGLKFFTEGCSGGRLRGRLDGGGICDWPQDRSKLPAWLRDGRHPDKKDGLCYKRCPKDKPVRIPGMPYLCYIGGSLSYGRGVGSVPSMLRFNRSYTLF
jgi:hypothetical protein